MKELILLLWFTLFPIAAELFLYIEAKRYKIQGYHQRSKDFNYRYSCIVTILWLLVFLILLNRINL